MTVEVAGGAAKHRKARGRVTLLAGWKSLIVAGDYGTVNDEALGSETKRGRQGELTLYRCRRTYEVRETPVVIEELTRIGR